LEKIAGQLDGLIVFKPDIFTDERGFFFESFHHKRYEDLGINFTFIQDNVSKSQKGTVRGLHYQIGKSAQGKLCQVILGKVVDIVVDIRFGSPTFGKHQSIILSDENHHQAWIPPGFAHGFAVLSDEAVFHYKCTAYYSKEDERTLLYNDPVLQIDWLVDDPLVSDKDRSGKKLADINKDFTY
jgi:dTDP-4-dehydrorhamnose 3,5-epimerase